MPSGLVRPSSEIEPIVGIQFGIFSPDEIERRSVVEITNAGTYDGNEPRIGGLFDPRMGVLDNGKTCRSCGQTNHHCPGHFGHFRLARPVYYIQFFPLVLNVLSCVCVRCSKLLVDKDLHPNLIKRRGEARWRQMLNLTSNIGRCGQETEDGCGARQPDRYVRDGIARIVAEWDNIEGAGAPEKSDKVRKERQVLEVEYVLRLFRRITDEDVDFMGLSRYWCRPDWMICTVMAIPPPQVRPSVIQDNNQRSEDDLTHKLFEIVNTNNTLQDKINNNAAKNIVDEYTNVLQYHIATLVDNQIPGVAPSAQRSGRPLKSIQQRLGSKEGRIRYNIQGKRVEFSARSVITPDPNISVAEIGVPMKIAMNLTVPERVTTYNRDQMYKLIQNGAEKYPGAKTLVRADGRMISLKHVNSKEIVLYYGDVVNRHLADGDTILFNRQPTLHRMSMMGHKVKVLPYNTFRLNVSVTSPYNADFDGDEMNAHIPQSLEASTELSEIAAVPHQIVTPRHAKPVIGVVQDSLVGSWRMTRPKVSFNRREFMNMQMWNKRFEGIVPEAGANKRFSGQQILSQLLPPINLEMGNSFMKDAKTSDEKRDNYVVIKEGKITQGIMDKDIFSKPSKGIVHTIFKDYGPTQTVNFIDAMQNTVEQFLVYNGFSVGISDLVADEDTRNEMDKVIKARKAEIENILLQLHLDLFDNNTGKTNQQEFEDKVYTELNKATEFAGKIGLSSLADENRLIAMVRAGSKGSTINIAQMMACVGQQAPEGRRIPYGFSDRTLPHYKKYDDGAEARGFVESSFIQGLTPQEFFFHAMSGREGLIDTAVKSVTGDTKIVIVEDGKTKCVAIGDWIDAHLASRPTEVEHFAERNMELLQLKIPALIPTMDADGHVQWGDLVAVTRHDPGDRLYKVTSLAGKTVTVTESQSLLVWNATTAKFEKMSLPDVKVGQYLPVTMRLAELPLKTKGVPLSNYLPKDTYLYGTDFVLATEHMKSSMESRSQIPRGWWEEHNGKTFTLPYDSKARLQRALVRSNVSNIKSGYVYPFTTNREHTTIPEVFEFNETNGIFLGLFLAEGNVDLKSGYVQITNNNETIREFVKEWFDDHGISSSEDVKLNHIGGVSSSVRGFSTVLAKFLDLFVGHGAEFKRVPVEAFTAPQEFIVGLLNGYFSGDGTVSANSVDATSASAELIDGISMLCTRIGIFGKVSHTQATENNLGTTDIKPSHRLAIRAQWATLFQTKVPLIDEVKNEKLAALVASSAHRNFTFQNDVVLDEITEIEVLDAAAHPHVYDLTVPSTFNFGLANGLHVRDTADTGYIQRQLVKAMEDLVIQFDGSVRDARSNVLQFHYGEDGANSTKIENQNIGLSKLTDGDILSQYSAQTADVTGVFVEGTVISPEETAALDEFSRQVLQDRKMIVEEVHRNKDDTGTFASVNLERLILNTSVKFQLKKDEPTDLLPGYVIDGIKKLIHRTQAYNPLWAAMLRFYLAPHKIIIKQRFTKVAFDTLLELIVLRNWQAWAQPGEQVGIIAAQSIGEPSTQMTLNSTDWDTRIMIAKNGKIITPQIGEFIDNYYENTESDKVQRLPNDQIYIELNDGNDWKAISCDEMGKMMWTKLEAITRHPVVNKDGSDTILEVTLQSGRTVKATKAKSFLTCKDGRIHDTNGSDLKIGDKIPIANTLVIDQIGLVKSVSLREILPATEWMYGTDVDKALKALEGGDRHWFQKNQGTLFTVPYSRSDAFREAFVDGKNTNTINPGFVYPKRTRTDVSQIPEDIALTKEFGFFAGAYLAEGMANTTQVCITNNEAAYLEKVKVLMDEWNVGTHLIKEERNCEKTGIKGTTSSLIIHSTLLAKTMQHFFGRISSEKTLPDWTFQAPDEFVAGLLDGYISGDGTVSKKSGLISATSVSKELLQRLSTLLTRYGIFATMTTRMPDVGVFQSVRRNYTLHIPAKYSRVFSKMFVLSSSHKQDTLDIHFKTGHHGLRASSTESFEDIICDTVKDIKEVRPIKFWVYDLTVEKTRNFMTDTCIALKDTFHLAGVAAKSNVTRGVPRLKELLKVTKSPKAISLTVYLKPEFRDDKEKAREVCQDLELTLLKDVTTRAAIYYDPRDDTTITDEGDKDLIAFYKAFEKSTVVEEEGNEASEEEQWSRWMLRIELDRERLFAKNISMEDIAFVLRQRFDDEIHLIYSDFNSPRLIMRIRLPAVAKSGLDDLANLKKFVNRILNGIVIRGVTGIKSVKFREDKDLLEYKDGKYEKVTQYVLDTDGTNYQAVMSHPMVDGRRLVSSHVHDIFENLGIEATRAVLLNEIIMLFEAAGADVNFRHPGLLCDVMTRAGKLMSADRYGINKNDIGPLAKASFEETEKILLRAAVFGEVDPITGVSANIMTGQVIRGGTAFSQLLLDESALMRLQENLPPVPTLEEEEEGPTDEQVEDELYEDAGDMCSKTRLRMNITMPTEAVLVNEPDVDMVLLED